jgi:hypothetical protein
VSRPSVGADSSAAFSSRTPPAGNCLRGGGVERGIVAVCSAAVGGAGPSGAMGSSMADDQTIATSVPRASVATVIARPCHRHGR